MCGLSGIVSDSLTEEEKKRLLRKMGAYQFHRGPDAWGEMINEELALGHNRLSILDIRFGIQPMSTSDGRFSIIFNGEIYNHLILRSELINLGYKFISDHSDTETILIGFQHWGVSVWEKLDGMFSCAIWDNEQKSLFLARDPFGIKPLFYSVVEGAGLIFSSELKGILVTGLIKPELNESAVIEYFHFRSAVHPNSLIRQIAKLPPGHYLKWSHHKKSIDVLSYRLQEESAAKQKSEAANLKALERLLSSSIEAQLAADVPVGLFLSGGVDSSIISAISKRFNTLHAFNIGTNSELDESSHARLVADHVGIPLHTLFLQEDEFLDKIDDWVYFNDDPVSDPSALALMLLSGDVNKKGIKVILSGEGSDELFMGYYSYLKFNLITGARRFIPKSILKWLCRKLKQNRLLDYLEQQPSPFLGTAHLTSYAQKYRLIRPEFHTLIDEFKARYKSKFSQKKYHGSKGPLLIDQDVRLSNDILARTDRATMAHSLEARVPYLSNDLAGFANGLDNKYLVNLRLLRGKALLKKLGASMVPESVIYRRKRGFDLPVAKWLNGSFKETALKFINEEMIGIINYKEIRKCFDSGITSQDVAMIWAWIILESWYRTWVIKGTPSRLSEKESAKYFREALT